MGERWRAGPNVHGLTCASDHRLSWRSSCTLGWFSDTSSFTGSPAGSYTLTSAPSRSRILQGQAHAQTARQQAPQRIEVNHSSSNDSGKLGMQQCQTSAAPGGQGTSFKAGAPHLANS